MKALTVILALVLTAACTGTADLPTGPSAIVGDTLTSASHVNLNQPLRVHFQVASWADGRGYFVDDVSVTVVVEGVGTASGFTKGKGNAELELPPEAAGHIANVTLTKTGYQTVATTVQLSFKPHQNFQLVIWE